MAYNLVLFIFLLMNLFNPGRGSSQDNACNRKRSDEMLQFGAQCKTSGVIVSPNYPGNYPVNQKCGWNITVDSSDQIVFSYTHLDDKISFPDDSLQIFDGPGQCTGKDSIGGKKLLTDLSKDTARTRTFLRTTTSNVAHICFYSDTHSNENEAGFKVSWSRTSRDDFCGTVFPELCACDESERCEEEWMKSRTDQRINLFGSRSQLHENVALKRCQDECRSRTPICYGINHIESLNWCYYYSVSFSDLFRVHKYNKIANQPHQKNKRNNKILTIHDDDSIYMERSCVCRRQCKPLNVNKTGNINSTSTKQGVVVRHSCKQGYHFKDDKSTFRDVSCQINRKWSDNSLCSDINECLDGGKGLDICGEAECINTAGSFICKCADGFEVKNRNCVDVDDCEGEDSKCKRPYICENTIGSFLCSCYQNGTVNVEEQSCTTVCMIGYWGDSCQKECGCRNSQPCDIISGICESGCRDGYSGLTCARSRCPKDLWGDHCQYLCRCAGQDTCDVTNGTCPNGCTRDWFGNSCEKHGIDGCEDYKSDYGRYPCENNGTCIDWLDSLSRQFICRCPPGVTGMMCGEEIDECAGGQRCDERYQDCVDKRNGYACEEKKETTQTKP